MFTVTTRPHTSSRDAFGIMDALFAGLTPPSPARPRAVRPRIDVLEREASYEIRADLPGVSREDIAVDIDETRVSISAAIKQEDAAQEGVKLVYSERSVQSFSRAFELPQAVDSTASIARFENGVLVLTLPKREVPKPTRVAIN